MTCLNQWVNVVYVRPYILLHITHAHIEKTNRTVTGYLICHTHMALVLWNNTWQQNANRLNCNQTHLVSLYKAVC